jgi:hypothetical protein
MWFKFKTLKTISLNVLKGPHRREAMLYFHNESSQDLRNESRRERRARRKKEQKPLRKAIKRGDLRASQNLKNLHEHWKQKDADRQHYLCICRIFKHILSEDLINKLAIESKFQQRIRQITSESIVAVLMMGCMEINVVTLERMCSFLRSWYQIYVKPQALQLMINRKENATFIKKVATAVIEYEINKFLRKLYKKSKKLCSFVRILLQDSTVISLPETLRQVFKGCGGSASEAAVKLDVVLDIAQHIILRVKYVAGKIPDSALSEDIINYLQEGDLVIRDLGYFNLSQFSNIINKEAYFISRLSKSTNVYLNKYDTKPVDLIKHLGQLGIKKKGVDIEIFLGKREKIPLRLIAIKVPPEVVESRRQQYKRARGRSEEPSESLQEWNGFTMMITNIPRDRLSLNMIIKLYKIRWQIELFFKNIKSNISIDKLSGKNKFRMLCLLYTKLAIIWIVSSLYAYAQSKNESNKEISLYKFTRWLLEDGRLMEFIKIGDISKLLVQIESNLDLVCKQKRRQITRQALTEDYEAERRSRKAA